MSGSTVSQAPTPPKTTEALLAAFSDMYRQELAAEEDVIRTLPFFATALGLIIAAIAYAANTLPEWAALARWPAKLAFGVAAGLLVLAIGEAGVVLWFISRAVVPQRYQRIGPEGALRARAAALEAYYRAQRVTGDSRDAAIAQDMRQALLDSFTLATPINRGLNERRYRFRALAASNLFRSLICAFAATIVLYVSHRLGLAP